MHLPLPLNELFLLNALGYIVLVLLFWFGPRLLGRWRWLVDAALLLYAAAASVAWLEIGKPNPMGLGYLSKGIESVLILALLAHLWIVLRKPEVENAAD